LELQLFAVKLEWQSNKNYVLMRVALRALTLWTWEHSVSIVQSWRKFQSFLLFGKSYVSSLSQTSTFTQKNSARWNIV
jgi:hypothetical protein